MSKKKGSGNHFWQSYSDMMAALLLVFVLVLAGTILQSYIQLDEAQAELNKKSQDLDDIMVQLDAAKADLDNKSAALDKAMADLESKTQRLDEIVGIRLEIIEKLKKAFAGEKLTIDSQTGAIVFDSDLLFPFAGRVLGQEGKDFLEKFMPKYFGVLLSDEFIEHVGEIRIEGHTDEVDTYLYNLELSQDRALNVSQFILQNEHKLLTQKQLDLLSGLVTTNGRSESDLIMNKDGTINSAASRRVEIQFQLKDEEMIKMLYELVNQKKTEGGYTND